MFLALLLLTTWCFLGPGAAAQERANVLVIFSNNRLLPANVDFDRGLNEAAEGSANVRYFAEFLDSPEFGGESYAQQTASYLREKYSARRPRVVVAGGQAALGFLLRYRTEIFPEVPVVHAAVDRAFLERHQLPADVIGTPADYDIVGTLRLALRLHPDARRVVVVTGDSTWDRDREAEVRASLAALSPALPVEQLAALRSEEITARLASLPRNAIVFTPGFFRDGAGRVFTPRESVEMMAAASGAPVYALFASQLGTGAVGGRMTSYVDMGRTARRAVDQLLRGDPASAVAAPSALLDTFEGDTAGAISKALELESMPMPRRAGFIARKRIARLRQGVIAVARAFAHESDAGDVATLDKAAHVSPLLHWAMRYAAAIVAIDHGKVDEARDMLEGAPAWPEESAFRAFHDQITARLAGA